MAVSIAKSHGVLLVVGWVLCCAQGQQPTTQDAPQRANPAPPPAGGKANTNPPAPVALITTEPLEFEQAEQLYLQGKISARQLQKLIELAEERRDMQNAATTNAMHTKAIEVLRHAPADPSKNPAAGPAIVAEQVPLLLGPGLEAEDPVEKGFSEIEAKMDELLSFKLRREETTVSTNKAPAGPLTKRQRLNELLRLYVSGKLSEQDYNKQRAQIVAERTPPAP